VKSPAILLVAALTLLVPFSINLELMYMQEAPQKTAQFFVGRLSEVEKSLIRSSSNDDRLEYLRQAHFGTDNVSPAEMVKAKALVDEQFRVNSLDPLFGSTWKF
jgi:hypothetical protein